MEPYSSRIFHPLEVQVCKLKADGNVMAAMEVKRDAHVLYSQDDERLWNVTRIMVWNGSRLR